MSDLCKRHTMADGVTPNTQLTCCVWCAIEMYESRLGEARRLLQTAVPNTRLVGDERASGYQEWKNRWSEFMTNTFSAETAVMVADAMNKAFDARHK